MKTQQKSATPPEPGLDSSGEDDSFKPWSLQRPLAAPAVGAVLDAAQRTSGEPQPVDAAQPALRRWPTGRPGSILLLLVAAWVVGAASLVYGPFAWKLTAAVSDHPEVKPALWVAAAVIAGIFLTMWILIFRGSRRELVLARAQLEQQRQSEARLAASLREKDSLLKEAHHRVKNNMQLIASLVSLQQGNVPEGPLRHLFQNFQGRVRTFALISERLYQSQNLAMIDMPGFVSSLGEDLLRSNDAAGRVTLETDVEPLSLDVDTAVPCGLIMNELLTNSLRHGFPAGRPGVLSVSLHANGDKTLRFNVRDNGVGQPPGLDFETCGSLGMQLVQILTAQLEGKLQLDRSQGTNITIAFPRPSVV